MSKMLFIGRFLASILALLIASSVLHTHGQSQSPVLSDEDEAEILESLIKQAIKPLGSEFGIARIFSSENISSVLGTRIAKHGFELMASGEIYRLKQDHVLDYVVLRSIYLKDGIAVVRLSAVTEGRPCFGAPFSRQRSFTYEFQKNPTGWAGKLVTRPVPFPLYLRESIWLQ